MIALACLVSSSWGETPSTRSLSLNDITSLEAFGRGSFSPDGRWAVYEKRGPYDTIPRFEFAQRSAWSIMDLWLVDLKQPGAAPERLLPNEGPGLLRVAWSPSGKRMLIYRLQGGRFEIGIVTLADRSVHWTGLVPEIPGLGASAQWVSDDAVVVMTRPDRIVVGEMRDGAAALETLKSWNTGHPGGLSTIHANSAEDVLRRVEDLMMEVVADPPRRAISQAIDRIVHIRRSPEGRRVEAVLSVDGLDGEDYRVTVLA